MLPQLDLSTLKPCTSLDRKILTEADLNSWQQSLPFEWAQEYIKELIESTSNEDGQPGPAVVQLCEFLDRVNQVVQEAPPFDPSTQKHEFSAFRSKLAVLATALHLNILPSLLRADVLLPELQFHLLRSFGSQSRLDYGTGHELSFLLYLLSLRLTGIVSLKDSKHIVEKVWSKYWGIVSEVRKKFGLKVAGRRGIWKKDEETGRVWFDQGASEARAHPTRNKSSSSLTSTTTLHLNISSTSLNLLRSLLSPHSVTSSSPSPSTSSSTSRSGTSTPSNAENGNNRTPSPLPRSQHESRSDLFQLYLHTTLISLPCLLHLRFGPLLPFATQQQQQLPSSADEFPQRTPPSNSFSFVVGGGVENDLNDDELETVQNKREGFESTVAPWNLPTLSGQEQQQSELSPTSTSTVIVGGLMSGLDLTGGDSNVDKEEGGGGEGRRGGTDNNPVRTSPLKRGKSRLSMSELAE